LVSQTRTRRTLPSSEVNSAVLSDAATETDGEATGPTDLSHLADRAEFLDLMSRNPTQGPSKSELRRRQKYINDPDATESDSDSPQDNMKEPFIPRHPTSNTTSGVVEVAFHSEGSHQLTRHLQTFEPKPRFTSQNLPRDIGPHVLNAANGIQIPSSINRYLRPYQRQGVEFLWRCYSEGNGGILGDDMVCFRLRILVDELTSIIRD